MRRRDFLKTTSTLLAATTLPDIPALAAEPATQGRTVLPMNRGWRYHPSKVEGAEAITFNDASFETVVIPHTNIKLPWHSFDDKIYDFVSTYRRRFKTPAAAKGNRVFIDFEGAMTASTLWINGVSLGEYKGGFTPFTFELTEHLKPSGENVLTVQLDSTERADIPPFGNEIDYLTFGGIYREVSLRIVSPTFLENIFAQPKDVLSGQPTLDVQCFLQPQENASSEAALTLEATLYDGERIVAKSTETVPSGAGESHTLHLDK